MPRRSPERLSSLAVCLLLLAIGCSSPTDPSQNLSLVRMTNVGSRNIEGLVVLFPNERLEFGAVPAGATTPYLVSRVGVYGYAAYEFLFVDVVKHQPVIDWVGEQPMKGEAFTYSIELLDGPSGPSIRLAGTARDD